MERRKRRSLAAVIALSVLAACLVSGCGSESGSGSSSVAPGTPLELFSEDVEACTPLLEEASPDEGTYDISSWEGWDPEADKSVFGTLFDPGIGRIACIHKVAEILDTHIGLVNTFSDEWSSSGTYTSAGMTAEVDTTVPQFVLPFLGFDSRLIALEKMVTLRVPSDNLTLHMAFSQSGEGNQIVIEQYSKGQTEAGVFIAQRQASKTRIWYAGVSAGDKVQLMWEGDTSGLSFMISVCTNAGGGNWEAMGGGFTSSGGDDIAVMARNNVAVQLEDEYYVHLTLNALEEGAAGQVLLASDNPPGTSGALAYINVDMDGYPGLGYLGPDAYPEDADALAWED
ncbi:MAG TPA: hypothetical protein PLS81_09880 [Deltaproteobacteria bacterium]|nr:hypothetical protein [Deltaproteobacteria bacterium]HOM29750.1 hypothetical protein [Deltaproteobacteria bacterium]HPP80284.1 hypothetical protein [Deltaproteobacteria bacterium]